MMDEYKRAMGATERMRLWFPNINVVMAARIIGRVSGQDLRAAVNMVRKKHPLLGARIELDEESAGWFTTHGVPKIPIEVSPRATDSDYLRRMREELKRSWPVGRGPLARFVLLHSPEASDLIVNAHHSICDARSLAFLIRDILTFLSQPTDIENIEPVIPVALEKAIPSSVSSGLLTRLVMRRVNRRWLKKGISFDESDYQDLHRRFWEKHEAAIFSWFLTGQETSALVARCRQRKISINSALYAAFLVAQHRVQGGDRDEFSNVLVPVDFRDYLTQDASKALGLYASALQLRFDIEPGKPFWETAQNLGARIKQQLTDKNVLASQRMNAFHPSLLDGLAFAMFGELDDKMARGLVERIRGKMRTGILVSNLGRLDFSTDYGDLFLAAIIPPAIYAGNAEKALEALTIGGKLYLTLTFDESNVSRETVNEVKKVAMQILTEPDGW